MFPLFRVITSQKKSIVIQHKILQLHQEIISYEIQYRGLRGPCGCQSYRSRSSQR